MISLKSKMPEKFFDSGNIVSAEFAASVNFIQTSAQHTIGFIIPNKLPAKNDFFDSRIVVYMPPTFTSTGEAPLINTFDTNLRSP